MLVEEDNKRRRRRNRYVTHVSLLMTVNHTHMHVVLAVFSIQVTGMLIAIVKIFNCNVWQYIIRREKASRRVWWRK